MITLDEYVENQRVTNDKSLWEQLQEQHEFMDKYNSLNEELGNALGQLKEQPQDIQGRDTEIELLHAVLERPKTPVALLLGQAGVGKTALVEQFGKELNSGNYRTHVEYKYLLITLRLGTLASLEHNELQSRLSTLLDDIGTLEGAAQQALNDDSIRLVLFMDEVHMLVTIFGPGTKIGGDVMKDVLARSPIRVIAATTRREYDSTIAVDKPLSERFKQIEMNELPPKIVTDIINDWWAKVAPDVEHIDQDVVQEVIEANAIYRSDSAEPRKSLDIMEDLISYARRTGEKPTVQTAHDIFRNRYSINLDFSTDAKSIYENIRRRVKGQPFALYALKRLFQSMMFQIDPRSNKPMATALFTGPTGVGKTETVKAIAEAMYPGQHNVLFNINMPDYQTPDSEKFFRKRLGEHVRHTPNAIILLDELEKADDTIKDALLVILDEGLVSFDTETRDGHIETNTVSLRNTIVIGTTNAGHEVFQQDAKHSQREATKAQGDELTPEQQAEVDALYATIYANLAETVFRAEFLGRFQRIVPYRSLESATLLKITEIQLQKLFDRFEELRGIHLEMQEPRQWDKQTYDYVTTDVALYITFIKSTATDSSRGGARDIKRQIDTTVTDAIVDAVLEHPDNSEFRIEVSRNSRIYDYGAEQSEGGVIVYATD